MLISFFVTGADLGPTQVVTGWHAIWPSLGPDPLLTPPSISAKPSKLSSSHSPLHSITQCKEVCFEEIQPKNALGCESSASCLYVYKVTLRLRSRERIWMTFLNLIKYIPSSLDYPDEGFGQEEAKGPSLWDAVRILPLGGATVPGGLTWKERGKPQVPCPTEGSLPSA